MRHHRTLINEATLLASSPEAVAAYLRQRAIDVVVTDIDEYTDWVDEEMELHLLDTGNALITLTLAEFGRHTKVLGRIFNSHDSGHPYRLAVLSNRACATRLFSWWTNDVFGSDEKIGRWVGDAPNSEIAALFENPTLDNSFLSDFLQRKNEWGKISEERFLNALIYLARNERMWTVYDETHMDGYAEYSHNNVFDSAWMLAETAPVNLVWSGTLARLFDRLLPDCFSMKAPLTIAERWKVGAAQDIDPARVDQMDGYCEQIRTALAKLALAGGKIESTDLISHDDCAYRIAAYGNARLNIEQMKSGYAKDRETFISYACFNQKLWRNQTSREILRQMAWEEVRNDSHGELSAANFYNARKAVVFREHPEWFIDEEVEGFESESEVNQQSDILADSEFGQQLGALMVEVQARCKELQKNVGLVRWLVIGALVIGVWNSF